MQGGASHKFDVDVLVIGAGSAGFAAALSASASGAKVAIIERGRLGGECPNSACVPTKSLLHAIGKMSWAKAIARKESITKVLTGSRLSSLLESQGISHIKGSAEFVDAHTVKVGTHEWSAEKIIIAGGTQTAIPEISGLKESGFLTYADVVSLKKLPQSIAIIGGGPVAVEFAEIMNGFGVATTVIQHAKRLLEREEPDISAVVEDAFRAKGIKLFTGADVIDVLRHPRKAGHTKKASHPELDSGSRKLLIHQGKMEFEIGAEAILVATGKASLASGMKVEAAGIELDERGYIKVDKHLCTSQPHIFAAGDVKQGPQFTHVASYDGDIAGHNATHAKLQEVDYRVIPRGTFCDPEVGSVGITEQEARAAKKFDVGIGRAYFAGFGKALTRGNGEGLVKVVVDLKSGMILGAGIVGDSASELIHELALAMKVGAKYHDVAEMMHAYPTGAEVVKMACANVE